MNKVNLWNTSTKSHSITTYNQTASKYSQLALPRTMLLISTAITLLTSYCNGSESSLKFSLNKTSKAMSRCLVKPVN